MTTTEQLAQALLAARRDKTVLDPVPWSGALADAAQAYAVQELLVRNLPTQPPGFPRYWKTGGLGREGLYPHAPLPAEGVWTSPADARGRHFNRWLIEAEVAFRLARDVGPSEAAALDPQRCRNLFDAMLVTIEVVDSRWRSDAPLPPMLKLADLQAHGALVLGPLVPFANRDWASQPCSVQIGGNAAVDKRGSHPFGDPTAPLAGWLRHATRDGATAPAGTVVTTGSWCGMLPGTRGDRVVVAFPGVGEASVQL